MTYEPNYSSKMRQTDRVFVLEPMEGGAKTSTGILDKDLFTGNSNLHAKMDPTNCMWYLEYDSGGLIPPALRNRWTSFSKLKEYVTFYFNRRNVRIKEILE